VSEREEREARERRGKKERESNVMESWKRTFCFVVTVLFLILSLFLNKVLDYCINMVYFVINVLSYLFLLMAKLLLLFEFVMVEILP